MQTRDSRCRAQMFILLYTDLISKREWAKIVIHEFPVCSFVTRIRVMWKLSTPCSDSGISEPVR